MARTTSAWLAISTASLCALPVGAQTVRPDAGSILQPERQIPALPPPGGAPAVVLPPPPPAAAFDRSIRVTPAGFRIEGNTVFGEAQLQQVVAPFVGQPTDMQGLLDAAAAVRRFYQERGYVLTEAYLPRQQFAPAGGTVTIQVLEGRLGRVDVRVEGQGISPQLAQRIVQGQLHPGEIVTEDALEKPVLLLRDLPGVGASASVEPGANVGEADLTVVVQPEGRRVEGMVGVDNYGVRSAGQLRAYAAANWNNPTGHGDLLDARVQTSEREATNLYRVGYTLPFGASATKLAVAVARTDYALGQQFAALGATGVANIYEASLTQPFVRTRERNLLGALAFERKDLTDRTDTPASTAHRRDDLLRASVLGNFTDHWGGDAFTSYALSASRGHLHLGDDTLAADQAAGGAHTAGSFSKLNLEALRNVALSAADRVSAGLQAQWASKNLTSAEKIGLGGPTAVRGYPVGEAVGDEGAIVNLEYRHQFPVLPAGLPLAASVFYDWGAVRYNVDNTPGADPNHEHLSSAGLGLAVGAVGKVLLSAQLAWRLGRAPASDPDRHPRAWVSLQYWM